MRNKAQLRAQSPFWDLEVACLPGQVLRFQVVTLKRKFYLEIFFGFFLLDSYSACFEESNHGIYVDVV